MTENPNLKTFYVRQEYLEGNKTSEQHCSDLLERSRGMNVVAWVGGAKSEHQYRWDWAAAGIPVQEPLVPDVEAGIDRVFGLFQSKRLFVFNTCAHLKDELGTYSRKLGDDGQPTEAIADKQKFHLLDSARYVGGELTGEAEVVVQPLMPVEVVVHRPPEGVMAAQGDPLPEWWAARRTWKEGLRQGG